QIGCEVSGECLIVSDPRLESVEYYKASKLKLLNLSFSERTQSAPWTAIPPNLEVYSERGCRRLDARTYSKNCLSCIWGCKMAVDIIVDHWNPHKRRYRTETFCYGPKSCSLYKAGPNRKVPGRNGMVWIEEDWIDEEMTSHRLPDE
ncbi:MAG: hypothetical protein ABIH89_03150, partial [Elusimicrobiota bacterium]